MNREDYLTSIFKIMQSEREVTNKLLAETLSIAPSSVTEMLKKLAKDGMVIIDRNKIYLTDEGERLATNIISIHRLWEIFLLKYLNYNWQDVHNQADLLEHVTDDMLRDKLNEFLNYPLHCPHGADVYINMKEPSEKGLMLSEAEIGKKYQMIKVDDDVKLLDYLDRISLRLYDKFEILSKDEFDGSMEVKPIPSESLGKKNISGKALEHILVKEL